MRVQSPAKHGSSGRVTARPCGKGSERTSQTGARKENAMWHPLALFDPPGGAQVPDPCFTSPWKWLFDLPRSMYLTLYLCFLLAASHSHSEPLWAGGKVRALTRSDRVDSVVLSAARPAASQHIKCHCTRALSAKPCPVGDPAGPRPRAESSGTTCSTMQSPSSDTRPTGEARAHTAATSGCMACDAANPLAL